MHHNLKIAAAVGLVLGLTVAFAAAHSWYPPECCHDVDCAPVEFDLQGSARGRFSAAAARDLQRWHNRNSSRFPCPAFQRSPNAHLPELRRVRHEGASVLVRTAKHMTGSLHCGISSQPTSAQGHSRRRHPSPRGHPCPLRPR